ncbi:MAG: hypothetical protein K0R09_3621 [Clostridiales bacterium]|nr:hypothetical protein [Clostridiales bacterium]
MDDNTSSICPKHASIIIQIVYVPHVPNMALLVGLGVLLKYGIIGAILLNGKKVFHAELKIKELFFFLSDMDEEISCENQAYK